MQTSTRTLSPINPNTGQVLASVTICDRDRVWEAVQHAGQAQREWAACALQDRLRVMRGNPGDDRRPRRGDRLPHPACGPLLTVAGIHQGLLSVYANHDPSVSQFLPPLILSDEQAGEALQILDGMLAWVAAQTADESG